MENEKGSTKQPQQIRPFGARDKWSYMFGDLGCNMSFALNSYLMLFYTQYIGLSMQVWGVIILVLKIWDGINDPIMGGLMDALKPGKRGKFKTYIFYGSFVLAVSGAMCFLPIQNATMGIKILVCVLGYLAWDMSYTIVNVPYGAMNSSISAKPDERAQLSTYRTLGGMVGTLMVMVLLPMFCFDANNQLMGNRMFIIALIMGAFGFIAIQLMIKGVTERVHPSAEMIEEKPKERYNYFKSMKNFFSNRAAIGITLAAMCTLLMSAGSQGAGQILYQSFFKNAQISGLIGMIGMLPTFLLIPFVKPIVSKFGKREAAAYPLILGLIATLLMMLLPIKPDSGGLIIWVCLSIATGISTTIFNMVGWAMVADCIDYQEVLTGQREEGTVYSMYSLGRKLAQGFGASIIAFLLLLTGYNATLGADQPVEVANNVRLLVGGLQFVFITIQFILLRFIYNIDKKTMANISEKLGRTDVSK